MKIRRSTRISETLSIGPFRIGVSVPLGKGRVREYGGVRIGRTYTGVSRTSGGKRGKKR